MGRNKEVNNCEREDSGNLESVNLEFQEIFGKCY
jgi:hypothetical protein